MTFKVPEKYRVKFHPLYGPMDSSLECNGMFAIPGDKKRAPLLAVASDGEGWEHVSVSAKDRCPVWSEMCFIKELFWDEDDFVVQLHVPKADWVNCHPYCLHLWRKAGTNDFCERPPNIFVGL